MTNNISDSFDYILNAVVLFVEYFHSLDKSAELALLGLAIFLFVYGFTVLESGKLSIEDVYRKWKCSIGDSAKWLISRSYMIGV